MSELKIGQHIDMEYGGSAKILKKLGSGGQGTVYLVDFNGGHYALKWYNIDKIREPEASEKILKTISKTVLQAINFSGLSTSQKPVLTTASAI